MEPGCQLYCNALMHVDWFYSHFYITKLFNDPILFQEYTPFTIHWTVRFHFPLA